MYNLPQELQAYCEQNKYYYLTETPNGANQQLDKFLSQSEMKYAMYYNIIEDGTISTSDSGRLVTMQRNCEITLLTKDIKEDLGANYLPIIQDLIGRQMAFYQYLLMKVEYITSATYQSGVDTNDACLAMVRLTLTYEDTYTNC